MNVTLKPFDFAQAVARAGPRHRRRSAETRAARSRRWLQKALGQALDAVAGPRLRTNDSPGNARGSSTTRPSASSRR